MVKADILRGRKPQFLETKLRHCIIYYVNLSYYFLLANHGHYDWPRVPLCKEEQQPLYNTFGSMPNYTSEPHVHQASTVMCSMVGHF